MSVRTTTRSRCGTAWFVTSLSQADYQTFIDDTVRKGYNSIEFHVVNHDPRGNNPPFGGNAELPFSKRLDTTAWAGSLVYTNINNEAPDFSQLDPLKFYIRRGNETLYGHLSFSSRTQVR